MKKHLFRLTGSIMTLFCTLALAAATPVLNVTPQSAPDFPEAVDLWIPGGTPVAGNINSEGCDDSFSGRILRKLGREPESGRFTARYEFEVPEEGDYLFFAALIQQGRAHGSPVAFRFDDEPFRPVQPSNAPRECWGVSMAISWDTLGVEHLTAGKHSLEFEVTKKSQLGTWSFMCDGIAAIRTGGWGTIQIKQFEAPERAAAGETVELQLETEGGSALCEALLSLGDDVAVRSGLFLRSGKLVIPFKLPDVLGANTYRLSLVPVEAPENVLRNEPSKSRGPPRRNRRRRSPQSKPTRRSIPFDSPLRRLPRERRASPPRSTENFTQSTQKRSLRAPRKYAELIPMNFSGSSPDIPRNYSSASCPAPPARNAKRTFFSPAERRNCRFRSTTDC